MPGERFAFGAPLARKRSTRADAQHAQALPRDIRARARALTAGVQGVRTDAKDRFSAVFLRKRGALAPRCRHARRARVECTVDGANDAVVLVLLTLP